MTEPHYFKPSKNKKECEVCRKIYSECMKWVDLFVIEGPKDRNFFGKSEKAKHVTDLYTFEIIETIPELETCLKVVTIESTKETSYLLNSKGDVISWGLNEESEDEMKTFSPPMQFKYLRGIQIVAIACGDSHALALEVGMYVWSWGDFSLGQSGKMSSEPSRLPELNNIVRIAAGPNCSFAVNTKGVTFAWGSNTNMLLGVKGEEIIYEPTELDVCTWNLELNNNKKSYFREEEMREVKISGTNRSEIKNKKMENEDLVARLQVISKKVDFLEDESLSQGNKKLAKEWDRDFELKELIKLKEKIVSKNEKILKNEANIRSEIAKLETEKENLMKVYEEKEAEIIKEATVIDGLEKDIEENIEKLEMLKMRNIDEVNEEIVQVQSSIHNRKEGRRDRHAQVVFFEQEKEEINAEILKIDEEVNQKRSDIEVMKKEYDKYVDIYTQMEAVKKKQLSEKIILQVSSRTYQDLEDIMRIFKAIESSTVEKLTVLIGKFSYPEEVLALSNKLLDIIEDYVKEKFKRSGYSFIGKTIIIWNVIHCNIKLLQDINKLKATISMKMMDKTKKSIDEWNEEDERTKQKYVNAILKEAEIEKDIPFEDKSKKVLARKRKMMKHDDVKESKKSNWRACF